MTKIIQSPIKKRNWTDSTGLWTNSFLVASGFLILLMLSPFLAMGFNMVETDKEVNRTMTAVSLVLYAAAVTILTSSYMTYGSKWAFSIILMILAIVFSLTHASDNEYAKTSSYATVAVIAAIIIFVLVYGYGKDSSSILLADSIAGNYIYKIDELTSSIGYTNARNSDTDTFKIDDSLHNRILQKRNDLISYLWDSSKQDYTTPDTTNYRNFKNLLNDIDNDILGNPHKAPDTADLRTLVEKVTNKSYTDYTRNFSADRYKFMNVDDKKKGKKKNKAPAAAAAHPPTTAHPPKAPGT